MSVNVIFYRETTTAIENQHPFVDQFLGMFNYQGWVIDRERDWPDRTRAFTSLDEAWAHPGFVGYQWVYFSSDAPTWLDEYVHPIDNVVYVIGSDDDGYDGKPLRELRGAVLSIRGWEPGRNYYAATCVPIICYDRWLRRQEWTR